MEVIKNKFLYLFTSPSKEFERYKEKTEGILNLAIILLISLVTVLLELLKGEQVDIKIPQELGASFASYQQFINTPTVRIIMSIFISLIFVMAGSLVYYLIFKLIFPLGQFTYGKLLSIYSFAYIPMVLGSLIISLLGLVIKNPLILYSISAIFELWFYLGIYTGINKVFIVPKKSVLYVVALIYILQNVL